MGYKVLVADDSNNIQKVVKIIYEERNIELVPCQEYSSLSNQKGPYDLVLLDFSLSDENSGYDVAKKVKEDFDANVVLLFGTFDSIDEEAVEGSNIDGYLFKPFDSDQLLKITDDLLKIPKEDRSASGTKDKGESAREEPLIVEDTQVITPDAKTVTKVVRPEEAVGDETAWGVKIPGVIGEIQVDNDEEFSLNEDSQRIPEIIESDLTKTMIGGMNSLDVVAKDGSEELETIYPSDEDLEYPSPIMSEALENETNTKTMSADLGKGIDIQVEASSSKLISSSDLIGDQADKTEESGLGESTEIVDMNISQDGEKETLKKLKKQIFEELNEDLWSEEHTNTNILMGELGKKVVDERKAEAAVLPSRELVNNLKDEIYLEVKNDVIETLKVELPEILKDSLIPHFEEHIKSYCKEAVEKGIWELLPDLAEKVIKKELEEIRKSIDD